MMLVVGVLHLLECRPYIIAHDIEPKKAQKYADVDGVAEKFALERIGQNFFLIELDDAQAHIECC
jgi:hypothetical protein